MQNSRSTDGSRSQDAAASTRRRGSDGRYIPAGNRPRAAQAQVERQRQYRHRNSLTAEDLFEKLLEAVFLPGTEDDFIPAAAGEGPLVLLAENLLKVKFLLCRYKRSCKVRAYYFCQDNLPFRRQDQLPSMVIREANNPDGLRLRKAVYKKRRFPKLGRQATEVKKIREWLDYATSKKALKVADRDAAFEVFRSVVNSYRHVDGVAAYVGYPSVDGNSARSGGRTRNLHPSSLQVLGSEGQNEALGNLQVERRLETRALSESPALVHEEPRPTRLSPDFPSESATQSRTEEDECLDEEMRRMFKTARNDKIFLLLCKISDNDSDFKIDYFAGVFLEDLRASGSQITNLMEDALEYVHALRYGVKDVRKHQARFRRIIYTVQLLKRVRRVLKLRSYEEVDRAIGWESFIRNQDSRRSRDPTKNIQKVLQQAALLLAPSNQNILEQAALVLGLNIRNVLQQAENVPEWSNENASQQAEDVPVQINHNAFEQAAHAPIPSNQSVFEQTANAPESGNENSLRQAGRAPAQINQTVLEQGEPAPAPDNAIVLRQTSLVPASSSRNLLQQASLLPAQSNQNCLQHAALVLALRNQNISQRAAPASEPNNQRVLQGATRPSPGEP